MALFVAGGRSHWPDRARRRLRDERNLHPGGKQAGCQPSLDPPEAGQRRDLRPRDLAAGDLDAASRTKTEPGDLDGELPNALERLEPECSGAIRPARESDAHVVNRWNLGRRHDENRPIRRRGAIGTAHDRLDAANRRALHDQRTARPVPFPAGLDPDIERLDRPLAQEARGIADRIRRLDEFPWPGTIVPGPDSAIGPLLAIARDGVQLPDRQPIELPPFIGRRNRGLWFVGEADRDSRQRPSRPFLDNRAAEHLGPIGRGLGQQDEAGRHRGEHHINLHRMRIRRDPSVTPPHLRINSA